MRLITIERTANRLRVAYRWLDDPFAPARVLLDTVPIPLNQLRPRLEGSLLGEAMTPANYQLVVNAAFYAELKAAFPGFQVESVGDDLSPQDWMALRFPPDLQVLLDGLEARIVALSAAPSEAQAALAGLRARFRILCAGHSMRALQMAGQALEGSAVPPRAGFEVAYCDLRRTLDGDEREAISYRLAAISVYPGMARDERRMVEDAEMAVVGVFDPSESAEEVDRYVRYLGDILGPDLPVVTEPAQALALLVARMRVDAGAALLAWLDRFVGAVPSNRGQVEWIQTVRTALEQFGSTAGPAVTALRGR